MLSSFQRAQSNGRIDRCTANSKLSTALVQLGPRQVVWASQANLMQRAGRAGRVQSGMCVAWLGIRSGDWSGDCRGLPAFESVCVDLQRGLAVFPLSLASERAEPCAGPFHGFLPPRSSGSFNAKSVSLAAGSKQTSDFV